MAFCLVDTNVMLGASASFPGSALVNRAMPLEPNLREDLFEWLKKFSDSSDVLLLDEEGVVQEEYDKNMAWSHPEQEYGIQVIQQKHDRSLVRYVTIEVQEGNGERIAVLQPDHEMIVTDRADRKWVACALASPILYGEAAPIYYGAESDWWVIRDKLEAIGVSVKNLLPGSWYSEV